MGCRVGLNGAGRIGRALLRLLRRDPHVCIVAVNDVAPAPALAHLIQFDSIQGPYPGQAGHEGNEALILDGVRLPLTHHSDPAEVPWDRNEVDVVVEATGRFARAETARGHLRPGVRRVLVTAVCGEPDAMVVLGIHDGQVDPAARVISSGSCTTHAAALPLMLIDRWYGLVSADMTTVHCTTGSQVTIDQPHPDLRRARSAMLSMIPTSTSAGRGLVAALPHLKGKLSCMAIRVPTAAVSLVEINAQTSRPLDSLERMAGRFRQESEGALAGWLGVSDVPLVSVDFKGDPRSSVVDLPFLARTGDHFLRLVSWYDNEWGYANRVADLLRIWGGC